MKQYILTILVETYEGEEDYKSEPITIDQFIDGEGVNIRAIEKTYNCKVISFDPLPDAEQIK